MDYTKGKVYMIKFKGDDNSVYIGSTIQELKVRFSQHKQPKEKTGLSNYIKERYNGDWSVAFIELYENCPCNCKAELHKKEGEIIKLFKEKLEFKCLNRIIQGRDKKQYYLDRKEYIDKRNKAYDELHKEQTRERSKKHYELNKEKRKEQMKKWNEENKEKHKEYALKHYYKNHESTKEKQKEKSTRFREKNREEYNEYMRNYMRQKNKII